MLDTAGLYAPERLWCNFTPSSPGDGQALLQHIDMKEPATEDFRLDLFDSQACTRTRSCCRDPPRTRAHHPVRVACECE
jgi:hypothetical protein